MNKVSKYFVIDDDSKTFIFGPRFFQELFVENSAVNKAYRAAMALGCYDDYKPVMKPMRINPARNTATQHFTVDGVRAWLQDNNPDWLHKWDLSKAVRTADNHEFSFMVRKSYFLYENPAARTFCGMAPDRDYKLKPSALALKTAVEARLAAEAKSKGIK